MAFGSINSEIFDNGWVLGQELKGWWSTKLKNLVPGKIQASVKSKI